MARRVSLPTADDLFRPTDVSGQPGKLAAAPDPSPDVSDAEEQAARRTSGRVRHDEKMTVYVTADELLDLEHARLALRRDHGVAVDRGRLVREAIAIALAALEEDGEDSPLVQRLSVS